MAEQGGCFWFNITKNHAHRVNEEEGLRDEKVNFCGIGPFSNYYHFGERLTTDGDMGFRP
jgi:hypothetical protein